MSGEGGSNVNTPRQCASCCLVPQTTTKPSAPTPKLDLADRSLFWSDQAVPLSASLSATLAYVLRHVWRGWQQFQQASLMCPLPFGAADNHQTVGTHTQTWSGRQVTILV
jgi:hypothetical protein